MPEVPPHPAKWSQSILDLFATPAWRRMIHGPTLDPFAGVGAARLAEALGHDVIGLEIEPRWAAACPLTVCGDALNPPFAPGSFRSIVTSCTYGNRMADHHNAQEKCRSCKGTGEDPEGTPIGSEPVAFCEKCGGLGRRTYKRLTYRHQYGQELHPNNSGAFHWGPKYREFHAAAWATLLPLLAPGGRFVLNVKDHWKTEKKGQPPVRQEVTAWHTETVEALGWDLNEEASVDVLVPGMKFGANRDLREDYEAVLVFEKNP